MCAVTGSSGGAGPDQIVTATSRSIPGRVLIPGAGQGTPLRIPPVSLWGGVDAQGVIADVHHPAHGRGITGTVLVLETSRGSSSGSSVLAELIAQGRAPAAIIVAQPDAIIAAGCLAAAEIVGPDTPVPPVLEVDAGLLDVIGTAQSVSVDVGSHVAGEQGDLHITVLLL